MRGKERVLLGGGRRRHAVDVVMAVALHVPDAQQRDEREILLQSDPRLHGQVLSAHEIALAARVAALSPVEKERHFTFEHDGVLLHGFVDALHLGPPRALVVDYKTNLLGETAPEEIVAADYRLQRLVYALACFRAGADEVEVVYHFLERPDAVVETVFSREQLPELEAELSTAIARLQAGEFRPRPSEFACAGCPALDLVCAGPRLRGGSRAPAGEPSLAPA